MQRPIPTNPPPSGDEPLVDGFFLAGFECSDHRLESGRRLDLIAATHHDRFADDDYARLSHVGIHACREGVSWVRSEPTPGAFAFAPLAPRLAAAQRRGVHAIWDLMHFGWPDHVDVWAPTFPARFARYAGALARWLADHAERGPRGWWFAPINEISFLAWAGGDVRVLDPFALGRGVELKTQLVLATIEAIEAIRAVLPQARFLQPEPLIHVIADAHKPKTWRRVECDEELQFQAWDMLAGVVFPRLGGHPRYLDVLGANLYPDNQFTPDGDTVRRGDARWKPLAEMLREAQARYGRPLIVSETGCEGDERAPWLAHLADECERALAEGCDLHGVTLYPVLDHPGWVDDRRCENGLWSYADDAGGREAHAPLLAEVRQRAPGLVAARDAMLARRLRMSA